MTERATIETTARYCDLVMKGGVTSGIVYPAAILALSKKYRFKNIGGTSAGAIAAAAAAAAALGERRRMTNPAIGEHAGFAGLEKVAAYLKSKGVIFSQFHPVAGGKAAFRLLVLLAGKASSWRKVIGLVACVLAIAPIQMASALVLTLAIGYLAGELKGVAGALLPALIVAFLVALIFGILRTLRVVRENFFGFCSGMPAKPDRGQAYKQAFTEWLHETLQTLAGLPVEGAPLLFDDLQKAARYTGEPNTTSSINLQLITTAVSHREPRTLPFASAPFWFRREDFDRLFPGTVVHWLVEHAGAVVCVDGQTFYQLPAGNALPVVVATRMSLSFPLLFSAIPLYEPDWSKDAGNRRGLVDDYQDTTDGDHLLSDAANDESERTDRRNAPPRAFRVCWFSDGGICSNFPLHLFDAPLPSWPTFAIDLVYPATSMGQQPESDPEASVWLPTSNNQGWQRTYRAIGDRGGVGEVLSFLIGVLGSTRGWREQLQGRSPGHRDRIVKITLAKEEGGFNLDMPEPVLRHLHEKGTAAGMRLIEKFDFENHYWIRWRNVSASMQRYIMAIARNDEREPKISDFEDAYKTAKTGVPQPLSYKFKTTDAKEAAEGLLAELINKGARWNNEGPDLSIGAPRPRPHFQVSPVFDDTHDIFNG